MIYNSIIHIALASNNAYSTLLAALIKSICYNHITSEPIKFYIINDKISSKNQLIINSLVSDSNHKIVWINADKILPVGVEIPIDNSAFPFTAFLRLFAPFIIDENATKLIYLDVDMIVRKDISELWNFDLEDYTMAAVVDVGKVVSCEWGGIPNYKQLGIPADAKYFNSGLMIINPQLWKENNIPNKVFDVMRDNLKFVNYADQYGLNVVFAQKWKEINPLWNWYAHQPHPDPYNIHFLDIKPIFKSYRSDELFKKEFFKYLNLTPFKGLRIKNDLERLIHKAIIKIKKKLIKISS